MKAIIMAGGQGKRLRPLTCTVPKPLLKVNNKPVIDYTINLLHSHGIHEIGITLQYLPEQIINHIESGNYDCSFEFFKETTPLGTCGSVKACEDFLSDTFIVMSGDGLCDIDITKALKYHSDKNADVTLVLKKCDNPTEYGTVILEADGKIERFQEKPTWSEVFSSTVNTGIYIINKNVLSLAEKDEASDFSLDLFPKMMENGMKLYGYVAEGYWCDIGDTVSYIKANIDVLSGKVGGIEKDGEVYEIKKGVFVGKYSKIDEDAALEAPCYIGKNSTICKNAVIFPGTVIGNGSYIGRSTSVKASVIGSNVYIGNSCQIRKSVICDGTSIGDSVNMFEGSIIGENCSLDDCITVSGGAMIWPEKHIESDSFVTENVIWQTTKHSGLFENERISGRINTDITIGKATLLGSAFGSLFEKRIVISSNGSPSAQMLVQALSAGLASVGTAVLEIKISSLPASRLAVRTLGADGGIYVGEQSGIASIVFLDEKGADISKADERKLEAFLSGKNIIASPPEYTQPIKTIPDFCDKYANHIIHTVGEVPKSIRLRLVNTHSIQTDIAVGILSDLGCDVCLADEDNLDAGSFTVTAKIDDFGEKLSLYDKNGKATDRYTLDLIMNYIAVKSATGEKYIIADYNSPKATEEIARASNGAVIRTKSGTRALINEIIRHESIPDSVPIGRMSLYFDGIMLLIELVKQLARENKSFDEFTASLPEIHLSEKETYCPWEKRADVLEKLSKSAEKKPAGCGLRIKHKYGWSLILPDCKRAMFKVYSEGFSEEYAEEMTDICIRKIKELTNGKE